MGWDGEAVGLGAAARGQVVEVGRMGDEVLGAGEGRVLQGQKNCWQRQC